MIILKRILELLCGMFIGLVIFRIYKAIPYVAVKESGKITGYSKNFIGIVSLIILVISFYCTLITFCFDFSYITVCRVCLIILFLLSLINIIRVIRN